MRMRTGGFTLIELVVVVVILGLLAAVAVPKFIGMRGDTRAAAMKSLEGMMRSANGILYAKATGAGQESADPGSVTINGITIATKFGYARDAADLALIIDLDPRIVSGTCGAAPGRPCFYHSEVARGSTGCNVSYEAPVSAGGIPAYKENVTACN